MRFLPACTILLTLGCVQAFGAAADGKAVFDAKCKACHKADGSGMAAMKMRPLGSADVQAKSDADLKKDITTGVGKMKAQSVTDAQATDLVAYIRTLKQ
ncbi:MAG TPA: cytochrome c [Bryobacteraceae bacterium]|nr:cytochrome c [Bryobacteraceae bacterium]